jgi:hypothetical protein
MDPVEAATEQTHRLRSEVLGWASAAIRIDDGTGLVLRQVVYTLDD